MLKVCVLVVWFLCAVSIFSARADTIITFDASGTFYDGSVLSGTLTVDTTTGFVTGVDLNLSSPEAFTADSLGIQESLGGDYLVSAGPPSAAPERLDLYIVGPSLVGYDGGPLDSFYTFAYSYQNGSGVRAGELTPVPEPSSLVLLSVGLLGMAALVRSQWHMRR